MLTAQRWWPDAPVRRCIRCRSGCSDGFSWPCAIEEVLDDETNASGSIPRSVRRPDSSMEPSVIVPGTGHNQMLYQPEAVADHVLAILNEVQSQP